MLMLMMLCSSFSNSNTRGVRVHHQNPSTIDFSSISDEKEIHEESLVPLLLLLIDPSPKGVEGLAGLRGRDPLGLPNLIRGRQKAFASRSRGGASAAGGLPIQEEDHSLDDIIDL